VEENSKGKDEIQGSLHCATDDETVCRFGRDDVGLRRWGGQATATTTATATASAVAGVEFAAFEDALLQGGKVAGADPAVVGEGAAVGLVGGWTPSIQLSPSRSM
jgi:hypothetical protein